jgi:3D (Asp-Asp-Asp) domain-containing protein
MKKYVIALLLIILMITIGIFQAQSQINNQKENIKTLDKNVDICDNKIEKEMELETEAKVEPTNNNYIIMQASAYTKSIEEGTHKGITRSGTQVSRGTVAVDPRVIPLGTKLYVENYGHAVALDTGGAIKENRIDLYMETKDEAFEFGRKEVRVWIIE